MSENVKNIETCRGEDVLAEVSAAPQDPHFGSLVNEAFDPMQQQALHQAGYDGYSEVIEQHKPYTFASAIIQMKSNLLLLLRALWQFPFGSGTHRSLSDAASLRSLSDDASLRSLADMWQHYITRLQGNETYGIPSRLSSLTDLPSAPLLLADRKISGADVPDGMSLVHILCTANEVTELTDDNIWDADTKTDYSSVFAPFPNLQKFTMGCEVMDGSWYKVVANKASLTELNAPNLRIFGGVPGGTWAEMYLIKGCSVEKLDFPALEAVNTSATTGYFIGDNSTLTEFKAENLTDVRSCSDNWVYRQYAYTSRLFINCTALKKIETNIQRIGNIYSSQRPLAGSTNIEFLKLGTLLSWNKEFLYDGLTKLVHLEIGDGTAISLDFSQWVPDSETLAHQDFLPNFRTYIALRLATFASNGPTLTLSAAVFSSIWDANGNPQVLGDGLDQLRADIHNIVKTTKHWDVNKAS